MPSPDATAHSNARGDGPLITVTGIRLALLDIEGTTCPVSFVSETLFPYASEAMEGFVAREGQGGGEVERLLNAVAETWRLDRDPEAVALRERRPGDLTAYLRQLIQRDSKLPALKDLQGLVWRDGYAQGELVAPLYPDVAEALRRWKREGVELGVYSSGSVAAQQLLYRHSTAGDLRRLFSHWFDTRVGRKQESTSYTAIASSLNLDPGDILFISDAAAECKAADEAGMTVLFSDRYGNPNHDPKDYTTISDFQKLVLLPR
ncbi:MAG: acireductone synthase [Cyanobium sp. PLM2.Bin73]|nr:MAG: acireductone synthase [Cyanobium sp. PLM2.Bin73]